MVTQTPEATVFIPQAALPPETMISSRLETVVMWLGEAIERPDRRADILTVLRLLCPFGDPTGLALSVPEQPVPLVCNLAAHFARQANRLDVLPFLDTLGAELQSDAIRQAFAELFQRPGPNANVLWSTHTQLAPAQAYPWLAMDLQCGLIAALARTGWTWTAAAAKSMDAMITAALRIIPRLDAEALAQALASHDPFVCGSVIRQVAFDLTYLRHPTRLLPRATQLGYVRDCCRLLNHPEWVSTEMGDAPLGAGEGLARSHRHRGWQFDDDDPPETEAAPDRFRERHFEKLERQARRQVARVQNDFKIGEATPIQMSVDGIVDLLDGDARRQAQIQLGFSDVRDDGVCARPGVAGHDAVDIERCPELHVLEEFQRREVALEAGRAEVLFGLFHVEGEGQFGEQSLVFGRDRA